MKDIQIEYDVKFGLKDYSTQSGKCNVTISNAQFELNGTTNKEFSEERINFIGLREIDDIKINFIPDDDVTKQLARQV